MTDPFKLAYQRQKKLGVFLNARANRIAADVFAISKDYKQKGLTAEDVMKDRTFNQYLGKFQMALFVMQELGLLASLSPQAKALAEKYGANFTHLP